MALDLARLTTDVDEMSVTLVELDQTRRSLLEIARERLRVYAGAIDALQEKKELTRVRNLHWRGAYPAGDEPLDTRHPCPPTPVQVNVLANDGSQVPLDRHAAALFYAINIGFIVYSYGTERPPTVGTEPELHYKEEEILDDGGRLISNALVNARRTLREVEHLANLAAAYTQYEAPVVALSDGPLMWVQPGDTPEERRRNLTPYLEGFNRLRDVQVALGGYVDRPRSNGVLSLLHLASLEPDEIDKEHLAYNEMAALADARLFAALLGPGERSTLFIRQSPTNRDYAEAGHEIYHCYLNVSADPAHPLIARLETPAWAANDPARLALLHGAIWQQCQIVGGYPYVLARAHELALISTDERRDLEEMVMGALRRRGLAPRPSEKAWQKSLTGGAKRHHRL
jgi:hypothetical protein